MAIKASKTSLLVFSFLLIIFLLLIYTNSFSHIRARMTDKIYDEKKPLDSIVIIKIDDESINKIGRWPWDRSIFSSLLSKIEDAKAIGMDISFFEKSDN